MSLSTQMGSRTRWILERHWGEFHRPLPRRWVTRNSTLPREPLTQTGCQQAFDFTHKISQLCGDVVSRCSELAHIDTSAILCTVTPARNRSVYGLQARVTPMRFRDGKLTRRYRGTVYQAQRYFVKGKEILYLVTFCLPRFLEQSYEEKLITIFHELYHISPHFNGDLRRHEGRYAVHTHSKKAYDEEMARLVRRFLTNHPDTSYFGYLRSNTVQLSRIHGGISGVTVPRPKMVPIEAMQSRSPSQY